MEMRHIVLATVLVAGMSLVGSLGASAAPASGSVIANAAEQTSSVVDVAGGCGRGWHRGWHGHCRPN